MVGSSSQDDQGISRHCFGRVYLPSVGELKVALSIVKPMRRGFGGQLYSVLAVEPSKRQRSIASVVGSGQCRFCVRQRFPLSVVGSDFRDATTPPLLHRKSALYVFWGRAIAGADTRSGTLGCIHISTVLAQTLVDAPLNLLPRRVRSDSRAHQQKPQVWLRFPLLASFALNCLGSEPRSIFPSQI